MKERHELLLVTIGGVFDEEEYAYWLVTEFSWILPTIVFCGGLVDIFLIWCYMKFAHPWKDILSQEKLTQRDKDEKEVGLILFKKIDQLNKYQTD